ncbi:glutamate ABC transporter substrate-binding protein [Yinghuangia seranimata]|uniref:glutamate ABC transporter substrate-binding protein n=1 Tax=Yinghuangia seranimata TaxID=408067 RepID=UPI00248B7E4F|nr:glutamate ABC transporter substrate-binding protein [Yinghuangia seranimata]MDI2125630.1 glutamate ABC transporter substrate-binding protein [Yinghuangia seranimata]
MQRIRQRGFLVAGVDGNSFRWGAVNADTREYEGFDIDLVHAIADDILGPGAKVRFVTMPPDQRIPRLTGGDVDVLVRTMTVTCTRASEVTFSSVYFASGHRLLVPDDSKVEAFDAAQLAGRRICVGRGSSAVDVLARSGTGARVVEADSHLDCLVMIQKGLADAVLTHESLAAGLVAQDPHLRFVGARLDQTPYGVAMRKTDPDLVRRVNAVLADYAAGGRNSAWARSYGTWLAAYLGAAPTGPPAATYAD